MTQIPKLRRLLTRNKIEPWMNHFYDLGRGTSLAIVEPTGRIVAQTDSWDSQALANLIKSAIESNLEMIAIPGSQLYPLTLSGQNVGTLLVQGEDAETSAAISVIAGRGLELLLKEAHENRGLAKEVLDRYREVNLLYHIGETIGATLDPAVILRMLLEQSLEIIEAEYGIVFIKRAEGDWEITDSFGTLLPEAEQPQIIDLVTAEADVHIRSAIITNFGGYLGNEENLEISSLLWAPLAAPDKLLGGVILGRAAKQPIFLANDQNLLVALTVQAAIALEKAILFEETRISAYHLQELNTIGRELSTTLELEPLLERILAAAIELTKAERGTLFLVEKESKEVAFRVVSHESDAFLIGRRLPIGTGIVGEVAESGQPQIVNSAQDNESFFNGIDTTTGFITRSLLAVPLTKDDEVVGVLEVINRRDEQPFRQPDIARLASFSAQAVVAMETARLHEEQLAKQRMERELQLGHTMQASLIPANTPELAGWEFAAWWRPAREVSGDYYDFIHLDDNLGVVIADVADKGVHAALFMSLARSTVRTSLTALREPAAGIWEANKLIAQDAPSGMFVTLCYAQFRPNSGRLTYVNAGHNPPLWYRPVDGEIVELEPTGIFLGFDAGIPFGEMDIECAPGDLLVFFTDGVTEAMNPQREIFGEDRLLALVKEIHEFSPAKIIEKIQQALHDYIQNAVQSDDITIVIAKRC